MTDSGAGALRTPGSAARSTHYTSAKAEPTGWTGWIAFAAIITMMLGLFQAILGLVALFNDDFFVVAPSGLVVNLDFTTWGWVHLVVGIVAVLIGVGLLAGNMAARVGGIVIAVLSALANLAFITAYPLWSMIIITLDVIVIYAIVVHGREMKSM